MNKNFMLVALTMCVSTVAFAKSFTMTDKALQAKTIFSQMLPQAVQHYEVPKSGWEGLAKEMVKRDYTEKKVHSELVFQKIKYNSNILCSQNFYLLSGKNKDISDYASKRDLTKSEQILSGLLGSDLSKGAVVYFDYTCKLDLGL